VSVKIRLMRVGKKKQPTYRVVVADSRSPRDGRFIEILGQYAPRREPSFVELDTDRAVHWLQHGAQPTEQVAKILDHAGVWEAFQAATGREAAARPRPKTPKPKAAKRTPVAETPTEPDVAADAETSESTDAQPPAEESS
jgi:small subunit ribosomal protein S16